LSNKNSIIVLSGKKSGEAKIGEGFVPATASVVVGADPCAPRPKMISRDAATDGDYLTPTQTIINRSVDDSLKPEELISMFMPGSKLQTWLPMPWLCFRKRQGPLADLHALLPKQKFSVVRCT
jgi:hypothetical protein